MADSVNLFTKLRFKMQQEKSYFFPLNIINSEATTICLQKSKATKNLELLEMIQSLDKVTTSDIAKMKDGPIFL